jgi:signal transduction histidine kinase
VNDLTQSTDRVEGLTRPRILIADDDAAISNLLSEVLRLNGYATETAGDGEEVLTKVDSCRPDLILLDVMMPGKDGYEVLRILQANEKTKDIPVIMVTGRADIPDRVAGLRLGAGDYLTKPFSNEELMARIRVHLRSRKGLEERIKIEKLMALSTVVDGLAHEVRNPLTIIGGFARVILKKTDSEDPRYHYAAAISQQVTRLERMIEDIHLLKGLTLERNTVLQVNGLVRQVLQSMSGKLTANNISLSLNLDPGETKLLVDAPHFRTGIRNLVQNAVDAMAEGGKLSVTTRRDAGRYYIHIVDTGVGIKEEDLRYVFDPFYSSKMEGTGLGLTLALKVFQGHGGDIFMRSTPGVGTEVVVECPLVGEGK